MQPPALSEGEGPTGSLSPLLQAGVLGWRGPLPLHQKWLLLRQRRRARQPQQRLLAKSSLSPQDPAAQCEVRQPPRPPCPPQLAAQRSVALRAEARLQGCEWSIWRVADAQPKTTP